MIDRYTLPHFKLGLSATPDEAIRLCQRYLDGDEILAKLDHLNLGFLSSAEVPSELPKLLAKVGWGVSMHTVDLNLSAEISEQNLDRLRMHGENLNVTWFEEDVGIWFWERMFLGNHMLNPVQNEVTANTTIENVRYCQSVLGRPFLIENPPVYYTEGPMDMWAYLEIIAEEADCGIALDIGHMIGSMVAEGRDVVVAPAEWKGWSRVWELHLSGFDIFRVKGHNMWIDRHSVLLNDTVMEWAKAALARALDPCVVYLELEGASDEVVAKNIELTASILEESS